MEPTENGAVVLKIKIYIDKTSDNRALDKVDYTVSEYYTENMKHLVLLTSKNAHNEKACKHPNTCSSVFRLDINFIVLRLKTGYSITIKY